MLSSQLHQLLVASGVGGSNAAPSLMMAAAPTDLYRQAVHQATHDLPVESKVVYLEAMQRVPDLVNQESDPFLFLQCENWDAKAAAKRLVAYWQMRQRVFSERTFLPLTITGNGALTQDDITILETGYISFLPTDAQGRTMLFVNKTNEESGNRDGARTVQTRVSRWRCLFYMLHVAARESGPLVIMRYSDNFQMEKGTAAKVFGLIHSMPVQLSEMHCAYVAPPGSTNFFENVLIPLGSQYLGGADNNYRSLLHNHLFESPEHAAQELVQEGFCAPDLPPCLGGTWPTASNFKAWMDCRRRLEVQSALATVLSRGGNLLLPRTPPLQQQPLMTQLLPPLVHTSAPVMAPQSPPPVQAPPPPPPFPAPPAASSTLPDKRKAPAAAPKPASTKRPKAASRIPGAREPGNGCPTLQDLATATGHDKLVARRARKLHMDAEYARKRREREKKDENSLKETYMKFSCENAKLKKEEERLESLIKRANKCVEDYLESAEEEEEPPANGRATAQQLPYSAGTAANQASIAALQQLLKIKGSSPPQAPQLLSLLLQQPK